jgi:hypothetical protein
MTVESTVYLTDYADFMDYETKRTLEVCNGLCSYERSNITTIKSPLSTSPEYRSKWGRSKQPFKQKDSEGRQ